MTDTADTPDTLPTSPSPPAPPPTAEEEEARLQEILAADPDNGEALVALAKLQYRKGRFDKANPLFKRAIDLNPDNFSALVGYANCLGQQGAYKDVLPILDRIEEIRPDYVEILAYKAVALKKTKRRKEALQCIVEAMNRNCQTPMVYSEWADIRNVGIAEKLAGYSAVIEKFPNYTATYPYRAAYYYDIGEYEKADADYRFFLKRHPKDTTVRFNHSYVQLTLGNYKEGWENLESRFARPADLQDAQLKVILDQIPYPNWDGKASLKGKLVTVLAEMGQGDIIQFLRYIKLLTEQGARIDVIFRRGHSPVKPLIAAFPGVEEALSVHTPFRKADYYIGLLSLAHRFGTTVETIPPVVPFKADPKKIAAWKKQLGPRKTKLRIGFVVAGSGRIRTRTTRIDDWKPVLDLEGIEFILLQKVMDERTTRLHKIRQGKKGGFHFFGDQLHDFSDTAALIHCCDRVISIDTSVAHLAGTVIQEPDFLWILISRTHDWRWLTKREDSPWYPSARLIRQERLSDWRPVMNEVAKRLSDLRDSR